MTVFIVDIIHNYIILYSRMNGTYLWIKKVISFKKIHISNRFEIWKICVKSFSPYIIVKRGSSRHGYRYV